MPYSRFGTSNAVLPHGGPKVYPFSLDFSLSKEQTIDMQPEIEANAIEFISGVYVDNRKNQNPLEIITQGTNQHVGIAAGKQAYMPLLISTPVLVFQTPAGNGLIIPVHVVNFPVWPIVF